MYMPKSIKKKATKIKTLHNNKKKEEKGNK